MFLSNKFSREKSIVPLVVILVLNVKGKRHCILSYIPVPFSNLILFSKLQLQVMTRYYMAFPCIRSSERWVRYKLFEIQVFTIYFMLLEPSVLLAFNLPPLFLKYLSEELLYNFLLPTKLKNYWIWVETHWLFNT